MLAAQPGEWSHFLINMYPHPENGTKNEDSVAAVRFQRIYWRTRLNILTQSNGFLIKKTQKAYFPVRRFWNIQFPTNLNIQCLMKFKGQQRKNGWNPPEALYFLFFWTFWSREIKTAYVWCLPTWFQFIEQKIMNTHLFKGNILLKTWRHKLNTSMAERSEISDKRTGKVSSKTNMFTVQLQSWYFVEVGSNLSHESFYITTLFGFWISHNQCRVLCIKLNYLNFTRSLRDIHFLLVKLWHFASLFCWDLNIQPSFGYSAVCSRSFL